MNRYSSNQPHWLRLFAKYIVSAMLFIAIISSTMPTLAAYAEDDGIDRTNSQRAFIPHVGKDMCYSSEPSSIFGVQVYHASGYNSAYHTELSDIGASWLRLPVLWSEAEPKDVDPKDMNWKNADAMLAAANDSCMNIIATILGNPSWAAQSADGTIYISAQDSLAQFAGALAERYDGDGKDDAPGSPIVRHWELYNEPDIIKPFILWGQSPVLYANTLQKVYAAIKKANPNAVVLIGGLGYDDFEDGGGTFSEAFLPKVLQERANIRSTTPDAELFDVMNVHYFPIYARQWSQQGPGLLEKVRAVRNLMAEYDIDKPIMISETGHWVDGNSDEETQLRYLVQLFTQAVAADVKAMTWFTFYDLPTYEVQMGLMTDAKNPTLRPAYFAYQFIVEELGKNVQFVRRLPYGETQSAVMEVYEFTDPTQNKRIYVAWINPINSESSQPLHLPYQQVTLRNPFGHSSKLTDSADGVVDGTVTIPVGARPVFIEFTP